MSLEILLLLILTVSPHMLWAENSADTALELSKLAPLEQDELGASDLAILVPLQRARVTDPSRSIFGQLGTGMCNAPELDLGGSDPIMSKEIWQDWAKDVLLSVLPMPADKNLWLNADRSDLFERMQALPDVDTDATCPSPLGLDQLNLNDLSPLRKAGLHVALTQSLAAGACSMKNWRVVAARFEPCSYRAKILEQEPNAFQPIPGQSFPWDACGGAELRLVIQAFSKLGNGRYRPLDMAIHAFYKVEDPKALIDELGKFRRLTRTVLKGKTLGTQDPVWYADQKDLFLPHPGLREEMDCGGEEENDQAIGPIGQEWRHLLSAYAKQSRLFKLTWMTSDNSGANWSFGLRLVQPQANDPSLRRLTRYEKFLVESFSLSQLAKGNPYSPVDQRMKNLEYFYKEGRDDPEMKSEASRAALKDLIDIANPDLSSLNFGDHLGVSCTSCHTRDQTERGLRRRLGLSHEQLAQSANTRAWKLPLWGPIRKSIEDRNDNNLHNFGYGPGMNLGVSRRAIQEIEAQRILLQTLTGPDAAGRFEEAKELSLESPANSRAPEFERDILPILTNRCAYCHASKRQPYLLDAGIAAAYAAPILEHVCSKALDSKHMPPGKVLPRHEKIQLRAWAQALEPVDSHLLCP
ncbi:MAG: hypothetical protein NTX25_08515 [Proteobacteria bacterium]|nr:hypothetical protein [Pseudomonadota bacterium]